MMNCKEAREIARSLLEAWGRGQNTMTENADEALNHVRKCKEKECSLLRVRLEEIEDSLLPFSH